MPFQLPTPDENPVGLHQKYKITKFNGDPVDPDGVYFVLRLDSGSSDLRHVQASRAGAKAYAEFLQSLHSASNDLETFTGELMDLLAEYDQFDQANLSH